ncbi:hypothetical protein EGW08_016378 [Elysia chlorotica]|uniref:Uncharacterized protein n=1 Tax=Elysia chlorotica TaxID=188477 RepID=A0A3S0ZJ03_ELYCH|nr:hypothetical protein EGW08_016378 [Elysia chlorotica]
MAATPLTSSPVRAGAPPIKPLVPDTPRPPSLLSRGKRERCDNPPILKTDESNPYLPVREETFCHKLLYSAQDIKVHFTLRRLETDEGDLYLGPAHPARYTARYTARSPARHVNSPRFAGSTVTYSSLEAAAQSHLPATFLTPRNSPISPEELHRRHVAKSARLRSRLSGNKQLQRTQVLEGPVCAAHSGGWNPHSSSPGLYPSPRPASGHLSPRPSSGAQVRRPWSSDAPSKFIGHQGGRSRSRPATTGRYFNSSNGLRTSTSLYRPWSSSLPPATTTSSSKVFGGLVGSYLGPSHAWIVGPGLHINKIKLSFKGER